MEFNSGFKGLKHSWQIIVACAANYEKHIKVAYATWQRPTTARPTTFHGITQNQRLLVQL